MKLLLQMALRHFIPSLPDVIVVSVNPGLCKSSLFRNSEISLSLSSIRFAISFALMARSTDAGARNLSGAMLNAKESHEAYFTLAYCLQY